jgi:hypothetical protein
MWQSMNIPGTPLETQASMGAPGRYEDGDAAGASKLAHGDVGDEMAVHDIHVQPFSAALDHTLAFCGELAKV